MVRPIGFIDGISEGVRRALDDLRRRMVDEEVATVGFTEDIATLEGDMTDANAELAALSDAVDAVTLDAAELQAELDASQIDIANKINIGGGAADVNANAVTINGGKITAGTITALELAALAVIAGKIDTNAVTTSTIAANAITTAKLATDAIKSLNYDGPDGGEIFSDAGSFFDLANGNIITPGFRIDGGNTYVKGALTATSFTALKPSDPTRTYASIITSTVQDLNVFDTTHAGGRLQFSAFATPGAWTHPHLGWSTDLTNRSIVELMGADSGGNGTPPNVALETHANGTAILNQARFSAGTLDGTGAPVGASLFMSGRGSSDATDPRQASVLLTADSNFASASLSLSADTDDRSATVSAKTINLDASGAGALINFDISSTNMAYIDSNGLKLTGNRDLFWTAWGGGWGMTDATWMRSIGDRGIYTGGRVQGLAGVDIGSARTAGDRLWVYRLGAGSWSESHVIVRADLGQEGQLAFWTGNVAPILKCHYLNEQLEVRNNPDSGWVPILASAFTVASTLRVKTEVVEQGDEVVLAKAKAVKPIRFRNAVRPQYLRKSERFKELDARWQASGKTPLRPKPGDDYQTADHDCSIDECGGTAENPCSITLNDTERFGLAAEQVFEVIPEAVDLDIDGQPRGIDISQIASLALAGVGALTRKIEALEARIAELEARS